jgi:2-keto-4-pentenoate hydratase
MTASESDIQSAARRLSDAQERMSPCRPVRDLLGERSVEAAYRVQQINVERERARGRRISGRKIGLTSRAVQRQQGVFEPDFGTLFADMEYGHGSEVPTGRLLQPRVEAEIMLVLERDLDHGGVTYTDMVRAVGFVVAAIEIVDSRVADWDIRLSDTIADNAAAGLYVLGARPMSLLGVDLAHCAMALHRNGELVSTGRGDASLGHPLNAAVWLARTLHGMGTPLRAGDAILTGALGPMVPAVPGDRFDAHIGDLGSVAVSFEAPTPRESA